MHGPRARLVIIGITVTWWTVAGTIFFVRSLPRSDEVRGVLTDVQSREILNADTVTLRDEAGADRIFLVSPEVASNSEHSNSASHLRQHMMFADPVIVRYQASRDGPVAVRIFDAGEGAR